MRDPDMTFKLSFFMLFQLNWIVKTVVHGWISARSSVSSRVFYVVVTPNFKKEIDIFSFTGQSNLQMIKHCLCINGRLSSSIKRSLLLICFAFLFHLEWEEREASLIGILSWLLTNRRSSIAIKKSWDIQVRKTNFLIPFILNLDRSLMAVISSCLQWSKIVFLILLLSYVVGIFASIHYALSLCTKYTGSIEGCRLNQKKSGVAFCEGSCAFSICSSFLAV